jgi:lipid-binding SYLF domain-containing protein
MVQSKTMIFLLMTHDGLTTASFKFKGWSVGGEGSFALFRVGVNGKIDTATATAPIEAIGLTNTGLMRDVALSDTKVSRLKI